MVVVVDLTVVGYAAAFVVAAAVAVSVAAVAIAAANKANIHHLATNTATDKQQH